jgi:anaerobic ribonucleoside-triphosphate reductase activating protein
MDKDLLRIHSFLPFSRCNGPGVRAVLWVQGCSLRCPDCYNPHTHSKSEGEFVTVESVFKQVLCVKDNIEGITISEPLEQMEPVTCLLERIKNETDLTILLFSGYEWNEINIMHGSDKLFRCVDMIIAGRYDKSMHLAKGLLGSSNKTVHLLTERYKIDDISSVPSAEVIITPEGEIILSGIDSIYWEGD